jgi:MscS family membrane protein
MESTWIEWLTQPKIAGNEPWQIAALFVAILAVMAGAKLARQLLLASAERLERARRDISAAAFRAAAAAIGFLGFAVGLRLGLTFVSFAHAGVQDAAATAASVTLAAAIAWLAYCLVDVAEAWLNSRGQRTQSRLNDMLAPLVRKSLRVTIVVLALLQIATILSDKPLTSLLAGLGVGGLALALAAQETVKNLFGSLVILADKPFEIGDRIVVDAFDGSVELVGMRSTRIRTLDGNLVTIPNGELANKTIQNVGKRPHIRRVADIAITYGTPPEKVQRALEIVKELLHSHEGRHPDFPPQVYFSDFDDSSLTLKVFYWYHPPDYWAYMAFSEKFNLELLRRFKEAGIRFAFPTRTVHLEGGSTKG